MLAKNLEKKCVGGYGMLCVMRVLDEFEPKEATKVVSPPQVHQASVKRIPGCDARGVAR
jgi:hypothetical protein